MPWESAGREAGVPAGRARIALSQAECGYQSYNPSSPSPHNPQLIVLKAPEEEEQLKARAEPISADSTDPHSEQGLQSDHSPPQGAEQQHCSFTRTKLLQALHTCIICTV